MTVSHVKSVTIADWSGAVTVANSTGGTTTAAASDLARPSDWNSAHATTLSLTGAEVASLFNFGNGLSSTSGAGGVTAGIASAGFYEPYPQPQSNSTVVAGTMGTWTFQPFILPFAIGPGRINLFAIRDSSHFSCNVSANTSSLGAYSATALWYHNAAIYSQGTGSAVTKLTTVWTGQCAVSATRSLTLSQSGGTRMVATNALTVGLISQWDTAGGTTSTGITTSATFSTGASTMQVSTMDSLVTLPVPWFSGSVMDVVPLTTVIPAGNYWMAQGYSTGSGGAGTTSINYTTALTNFNASNSRVVWIAENLSAFRMLGSSTSPNSSTQAVPWLGTGLNSSGASASLVLTDIQNYSLARLYWNFVRDTR